MGEKDLPDKQMENETPVPHTGRCGWTLWAGIYGRLSGREQSPKAPEHEWKGESRTLQQTAVLHCPLLPTSSEHHRSLILREITTIIARKKGKAVND
jgi:hypothetical protein